jgi:hypothetical protein
MTADITHHHRGGTTIQGKDGISFYRAITCKQALVFYMKTKMLTTRGATPTVLLAIASEYTGKKYKRGQYQAAVDDLHTWIETMRAGLQIEDEREQPQVS